MVQIQMLLGMFGNTTPQMQKMAQAADATIEKFQKISETATKLMAVSDQYANIQTRLRAITGSQSDATALNDQICNSALRARSSYADMLDTTTKIASTAKDTISNPQQALAFAENTQKMLTIGGADDKQRQNASQQLTQALSSGSLDGNALDSILQSAPMLGEILANSLGVGQDQLRQLADQGLITGNVLRDSILGSTDEINDKLNTVPLTWNQIWTNLETVGKKAFGPVFEQISAIANSPATKSFTDALIFGLTLAGEAIAGLINNIRWLAGIISENMAIIEPILMGLALAFTAIGIEAGIAAIPVAMAALAAIGHAIASEIETLAILGLILAQDGLNAALYACPLVWIIGLIVFLVVLFYAAIAVVNYFAETNISATGIIFGAFARLFASIYNGLAFIANTFISYANFFHDVWIDPLAAAYNLFVDIWNGIVGYVREAVQNIIDSIMTIPGISKVISDVIVLPDLKLTPKDIAGGRKFKQFDYANIDQWGKTGYEYGSRSWFNFGNNENEDEKTPIGSGDGYGAGIAQNTGDTAQNTGKMAEAMEITEEDLKYLRDIAEQETINKYTTATVNIDVGGVHNTVNKDTDIDGIFTKFNDRLSESIQSSAEAVHI